MKNFEPIEAIIKFDTFLRGIGWWIPTNPDMDTIRWLNAWLGPHWILASRGDIIMIQREGRLVYEGQFSDFPNSEAAWNHKLDLKTMDDEFNTYLQQLSMDLMQTLQSWTTLSLSAPEIQKRVQTFFEFHKTQALSWLPDEP